MPELLKRVEVATGGTVQASVIWLHGLGADGHDFEPIVPHLGLQGAGIRFVFPHAPRRAVTINMGLLMPAWFDVRDLTFRGNPDLKGVGESAAAVEALMAHERERGVPPEKIALAGFSQGGAIALWVALNAWGRGEPVAGVVALSTFLPALPELAGARPAGAVPLPSAGTAPPLSIFQAHGDDDPMIPAALGEETRDRLIGLGHEVAFRSYPMQHEVCAEEIADIGAYLRERLAGLPA